MAVAGLQTVAKAFVEGNFESDNKAHVPLGGRVASFLYAFK